MISNKNSGETPPIVSVILATYNRAHLIRRAIESVLAQTLSNFEFIIIDDGSTDDTEQVVAEYSDPRIIYHKVEHGERSRARNIGVAISQGRYLAFLDSDDWYLPNKLEVQSFALDTYPECGLALGGWLIVNEAGKVILDMKPWKDLPGQPNVEDWLFRGTATPITVLVRKELYEAIGGFDPKLSFAEDVDLWIRLTLSGCKSIWTQQAVATVLVHESNSLRDYARVRQGRMDFLDKIFSLPAIGEHLSISKTAVLAQFHLNLAWLATSEGSPVLGMQDLLRAVEANPQLTTDDGAAIRASLVNYSQFFLVNDPLAFAGRVFQHLPSSLNSLRRHRRGVLAQVALSQGWKANANHDLPLARKYMLAAVRNAPNWLMNRGVIAILLKSFLGRKRLPKKNQALPLGKAA